MMNLGQLNKAISKYWEDRVVDYIFSPRFCRKHLIEFIKRNHIKDPDNKILVIQDLGICQKCKRSGLVGYLQGWKPDGKHKT